MNEETAKNLQCAKKSINRNIKFLEFLKSHLNGNDKVDQEKALWTSYCLDIYINNQLVVDIKNAMNEKGNSHA